MPWQDGETLANIRELLQDALERRVVQHLPSFYPEHQPGWIDFIALIEASRKRGDLDHRRDFYVRATITDDDKESIMRKANKYSLLLGRLFNELEVDLSYAYVTFATGDEDWPIHADPRDSVFVLCEGSVVWRFEDQDDIVLEKGDAIFAPAGTMHSVQASEPRAAFMITFAGRD